MRLVSTVSALALFSSLSAQAPDPVPLDAWAPIPIHTARDGHGVYAAGRTYKVRLDGRFRFAPALGSSRPHNLPFEWETEALTLGGISLLGPRVVERKASEWRYEYAHGSVIEAYDLAPQSVEQTFSIPRSSGAAGPLVVRGVVTTPLHAEPIEREHRSISFVADDGARILEYGAATVIDADGLAFPMQTSFDGVTIELRLSAEDVARLAFPIVVDPTLIANNPTTEIGESSTAMIRDTGATGLRPVASFYTRIFSATDHDNAAWLTETGFGAPRLVNSDLSFDYSTEKVAVAGLHSENSFAFVSEQRHSNRTDLEIYVHDAFDSSYGTGQSELVSASNGVHYRNPDAGGSPAGGTLMIVFDYSSGATHEVRGVRWHSSLSAPQHLLHPVSNATPGEVEPTICQHRSNADWVVAWPDDAGILSRIYARKINIAGLFPGSIMTLATSATQIYHQLQIDGRDNRYMLSYVTSPTGIGVNALKTMRVEWPGTSPNDIEESTLHGGLLYTNRDIAFDYRGRSHWVCCYNARNGVLHQDLFVQRVARSGEVVHEITTPTLTSLVNYPASVSFADHPSGEDSFSVNWANTDSLHGYYGEVFPYDSACYVHAEIGIGCDPTESETWSPSIAGIERFTGTLHNHEGNPPSALLLSPVPATIPLAPVGAPGCWLLVEPSSAVTIPTAFIDSNGDQNVRFSLPDDPVFFGDFYTQWLLVRPDNPLGVVTHRARFHQVR